MNRCEKCQKEITEKESRNFCSSMKEYETGNTFCEDCFYIAISSSLKEFKNKAISIIPLQKKKHWWSGKGGGNAYHFYAISEMSGLNFSEENVHSAKKFLENIKNKCEKCANKSNFIFVSSKANKDVRCADIIYDSKYIIKSLCSKCMEKEFMKRLNDPLTITLKNFVAPSKEESYGSTFEY